MASASCPGSLLDGVGKEASRAVALLRDKYPQYREMNVDGNPVIKLTPERHTAWSFAGE